MTTDTPPPPGSDAAIQQGCTCPVMDNAHGRGYMGVPGVYVYSGDCPLHSLKPEPRPLTVIPEELPEPSEEYQRALERLREDPAFRLIAPDSSPKFIDDGFGTEWKLCDKPNCQLAVVRPGKAECQRCDKWTPQDELDRSKHRAGIL